MNTDGSNGHTLVQNIDPMAYNRISWSVDGNWLIFSKGGQIWKVRRDGTQLTQLTLDGGWEPSISGSLPASNTDLQHVYLPLMSLNYCADFFDDFSNSASGWFVGSDSNVQTQYLSGEYRVYTSNGNYIYLFRSPSCSRTNYTAETDMRWASATTSGDGYGLLFGVTSSFSNYYMFYVSPDYGDFALLRSDASGYHYIQNFTSSAAIHQGAASNHLKVTRNGSAITLEVNGTILGTWYDSNITGLTAMGLFSNPYTNRPNSDARFDNFSAKTIYAGPLFISPTESGREPAGNRPSSLDHGLDKPQIARDR